MSITVERIVDYFILIYKPDHHRAFPSGYVTEQILVAEEYLGRPLADGEEAKHSNGKPHDNRPENIYVTTGSYKTLSLTEDAEQNTKASRNFIPCKYQKPCWTTIRAPIARKNKVFIPYTCSFQTEGDIYQCGNFWKFKEGEMELELQANRTSGDDL